MGDPPDPRVVAANLRKRRGVAKASVTRLITRVGKLEGETDVPNIQWTLFQHDVIPREGGQRGALIRIAP
jgi:hypothetical protein